jgi:glycosyltransferase involved in cell wall biosynthesis
VKIAINARLLKESGLEGIGRYAQEIISRMVIEHPQDEFHLIFDHEPSERFRFGSNVYFHKVGLPARHPILWYLWLEYSFYNVVKKIQADIIFSPESFISLRSGIPTVMTTHDLAFEHDDTFNKRIHINYLLRQVPKFHHKAAAIICVSEYTRQDVIKRYTIPEGKTHVVYNGVSSEFKPVSGQKVGDFKNEMGLLIPYFLYVGAIHPRKNIVNLIKAFEQFKKSYNTAHQLVLAGRMAWKYRNIDQLIRESEYKTDIKQIGYFDGDLNMLINGAEGLCYLSLFEGFGMPIIEAMAAGTPVIASHISAIPEVTGAAALLVDPHNINEIAAQMYQIIHDQLLREKLINEGFLRAQLYNWDEAAHKTYKILTDTASQ